MTDPVVTELLQVMAENQRLRQIIARMANEIRAAANRAAAQAQQANPVEPNE
jgi:F0F1-type ATP synthase delta subunit